MAVVYTAWAFNAHLVSVLYEEALGLVTRSVDVLLHIVKNAR